MDTAKEIEATLLGMADENHAKQLLRFFKTKPGEYGEGDRFVGLTNPQVRMVVKEAWRTTPLQEACKLVRSPLHEIRLCGLLIMVEQYLKASKRKDSKLTADIFDSYTSLHPYINNWDLVDLSAIKIVGTHEVDNPELTIMDEWIKPEGHSLWQQRIAMVSTWMLIRNDRSHVCFQRAEHLLHSPHDLLHKASGWMMREAWKKGYKSELRDFLERNVAVMPAVMLSYACEQMPISERHHWQSMRRNGRSTESDTAVI